MKYSYVVGYLCCSYSLWDSSGTASTNTISCGLLQSLLPKMLNSSSRVGEFFMEMYLKILLLTKYSFDLPGTGNCLDRMKHFKN